MSEEQALAWLKTLEKKAYAKWVWQDHQKLCEVIDVFEIFIEDNTDTKLCDECGEYIE